MLPALGLPGRSGDAEVGIAHTKMLTQKMTRKTVTVSFYAHRLREGLQQELARNGIEREEISSLTRKANIRVEPGRWVADPAGDPIVEGCLARVASTLEAEYKY